MKREKIIKLLQSTVREDVIIGLNFLKDYTYEELVSWPENMWKDELPKEGVRFSTKVKGDIKDNYRIGNIYCHFNNSLFFYTNPHGGVGYISL